jgi:hypothetical protein
MAGQELRHIYPIHPRPFSDESLESWLIRYSFSNRIGLNRLAARIGWSSRFKEFDTIEESHPAFTYLKGDLSRINPSSLLLTQIKAHLGPRWEAWVSQTAGGKPYRRFCPACFASDENPYLRLTWRLTFAVVCPIHAVLMESGCGHCGSPFRPGRRNRYLSIAICSECGTSLAQTRLRRLEPQRSGVRIVGELLSSVRDGHPPETSSALDLPGFFDSLRFLIQMLTRLDPNRRIMRAKSHNQFPSDEMEYLSILEEAWALLTGGKNLEAFIRKNQGQFNREAQRRRCPEWLGRYRKRLISERINWKELYALSEQIFKKGGIVSLTKLAEEAGIKKQTLISLAPEDLKVFVKSLAKASRRRRQELQIKALEEAIMSAQVCRSIWYSYLSAKTGLPRSTILRLSWCRPRTPLRQLLRDAKLRTTHYYTSFPCSNSQCPDFGKSFTGRLRWNGIGTSRMNLILKANLGCISCGRSRIIDVSRAPLHKDYVI